MERDQQFLEYVIKALVDHPEDVKINRVVDEMGVLLTLSVHQEDMGKVIGRGASQSYPHRASRGGHEERRTRQSQNRRAGSRAKARGE